MTVKSSTKYIGIGLTVTLFLLLTWFAGRPDILLEVGPDVICAGTQEDPCYGNFSLTSLNKTWYFYNKNSSNNLLVEFDKSLKQSQLCINDGRCKHCGICPAGFRPLNLNESFYRDYKYVLKLDKGKKRDFVVVGYKHNSWETVEWFIQGIGPIWNGVTADALEDKFLNNWTQYTTDNTSIDSYYDNFDNASTEGTHWTKLAKTGVGTQRYNFGENGNLHINITTGSVGYSSINFSTRSNIYSARDSWMDGQNITINYTATSVLGGVCAGADYEAWFYVELKGASTISVETLTFDANNPKTYNEKVVLTKNGTEVYSYVNGAFSQTTDISTIASEDYNVTLRLRARELCVENHVVIGLTVYDLNTTSARLENSNMLNYSSRGEVVGAYFVESTGSVQEVNITGNYTLPEDTGIAWYVTNDNGTNWFETTWQEMKDIPKLDGSTVVNRTSWKAVLTSTGNYNFTPTINWINVSVLRKYNETNIVLNSPGYEDVLQYYKRPFGLNFTMNMSNATASCDLQINDTIVYNNASMGNGTLTTYSVNLTYGDYDWFVNCTNSTGSHFKSPKRRFEINLTSFNYTAILCPYFDNKMVFQPTENITYQENVTPYNYSYCGYVFNVTNYNFTWAEVWFAVNETHVNTTIKVDDDNTSVDATTVTTTEFNFSEIAPNSTKSFTIWQDITGINWSFPFQFFVEVLG